jgi:HAD superfamily hydrolase (TIGR01484 family)
MKPRLICTDLDRTLLPNGASPESDRARTIFAHLVSQPEITLAYVSGRHLALVEQAIRDYNLPNPDWIIADVGSSIYYQDFHGWSLLNQWSLHISSNWHGMCASETLDIMPHISSLVQQPQERLSIHKHSFYIPLSTDLSALKLAIRKRLINDNISANLIYSIDENASTGLLDILPSRSGKLPAIEFLMRKQGLSAEQILYAGDSGNDLSVLSSEVPAVLVANAHPDVAAQAMVASIQKGTTKRLYLAQGGYLGMNGNYSAGILEGINHFYAEALWDLA